MTWLGCIPPIKRFKSKSPQLTDDEKDEIRHHKAANKGSFKHDVKRSTKLQKKSTLFGT